MSGWCDGDRSRHPTITIAKSVPAERGMTRASMDRARVWPDFRQGWIVHEDDDLLVIDKPPGVSSQASDPERADDIVTRLKRWLRSRGVSDYVGVHQRLDRETSGLLVYARRREANPSLAAQFEGRAVSKTYVACVAGWPA